MLIVVSLPMFGSYYFYDALEPLAKLLQQQLHFSDQNIGLLNSFYSIAPIATVLIGGILIDRIGTRKALLIFSIVCLVGSLITAFGAAFPVMATGRLIFGMGAESTVVAVTTAIAKWFKGRELSFALGIDLTLARGGTWLAQNSPSWAKGAFDFWQKPWLIGVGFVALCVIGAIGYWILEVRAEHNATLGQAGESDKIVLSDIKNFNLSYWYVVGLCVVFYSAIFPFETFAVKYFVDAKGTSLQLGGFILSVLTMFTMIGTPIVGLFSDKVGRRATIMLLGTLLLIPVFLMMAYTNVTLYVPMAMLGFAFTLVPAIIWPSVAYLVEQRTLGTALGLMTMVQNIGMASLNWGLGRANDMAGASAANPAGYLPMLKILTTLGLVGFVLAFLLRQRETGPNGHGLETITASSGT
ncbi:MAG TPA: MFS transporter [Candidatus Binatia bacterium]|nr:MFS transporter [Candidatus Binatia bacterium]